VTSASKCDCCGDAVGRQNLVWDHCHTCGKQTGFRGWICHDCNTALSEHIERHWDRAGEYLSRHECHPVLFDHPATRSVECSITTTRRLYIGNGAGDRRYVMIPTELAGRVLTIEQIGVAMGVAAGTARDMISGRRGKRGITIDGTHFIEYESAHQLLKERWKL
jgi:Recombination endonuclease VII